MITNYHLCLSPSRSLATLELKITIVMFFSEFFAIPTFFFQNYLCPRSV